jgi:hypothetical protein
MLYFFVRLRRRLDNPARLVQLVPLRLDLSNNVQTRVEESVHAVLKAGSFAPARQLVLGRTDTEAHLENLVEMPPVMHLNVSRTSPQGLRCLTSSSLTSAHGNTGMASSNSHVSVSSCTVACSLALACLDRQKPSTSVRMTTHSCSRNSSSSFYSVSSEISWHAFRSPWTPRRTGAIALVMP